MATHEFESLAESQPTQLAAWRVLEEGEEPIYHLIADGEKVGEADIHPAGDICFIDWVGPRAELETRHLLDPFLIAIVASIRHDYPEVTDIEDYLGKHYRAGGLH
ncbi:MAG: hypothetical protein Q7R60_03070 [bacterium]|nr:hypothetical protein [bacterium]